MTEADDTKRNDGGQAFPRTPTDLYDGHAGMTLRQWYAGQALAGLCANMQVEQFLEMKTNTMARLSYMYADAMLAEDDK